MALKTNTQAPNISTRDITNKTFELSTYKGEKILVIFFRFSTCPFCNLRVHELTKMLESESFNVVAIFQSSKENLTKHLAHHHAPMPILSDPEEVFYHAYQVKKSYWGMFVGMITRLPDMIKSLRLGNKFPLVFDGSLSQMPAEFLINEQGMIQTAYYSKDEGDHIPLSQIKQFFKREV